MGKVLTLISGKGGSGKTTLALSMAKLLAKCEKKVLLIDCDMSTHGATYFFESKITSGAVNTYNFLLADTDERLQIKAMNNIDFIPSVMFVDEKYDDQQPENYSSLEKTFKKCRSNYDAIILDCQAGYSKLMKHLIPYSDVSLFVLEADAVSGCAMRVLYTKLASELSRSTLDTYQIFNKVSPEESELYSSVKYGTFFTNLKPVLFDWSVRKAFNNNMIPLIDIENVSFTSDICQLTRMVFPVFSDSIRRYEINVKRDYLASQQGEYDNKRTKMVLYTISAFVLIAWLSFLLVFALKFANNSFVIENLFWIFVVFGTFLMIFIGFLHSERARYNSLRKERKKLEDNIEKLEREIKELSEQD